MARRFVHDVRSPRVVFGVGSRRDIPDEVRALGRGRVLLIGGRHEKPYTDEVADALGGVLAERINEVCRERAGGSGGPPRPGSPSAVRRTCC
jgi:alcohol dehydrogenase class IV